MLFWIDNAVGSFDWPAYLDAWDNLGEAGFKGDHFVLGDASALEAILKVAALSRRASACFRSVLSRYATLAPIRRRLQAVVISPNAWARSRRPDGQWVIPVSDVTHHSALVRAVLVCEHMYDCRVLCALAVWYLQRLGFSGIAKLGFHFASGGGGGTHLTLSTYLADPLSLGICVVDSDKPHSKGRLGTTASSCVQVSSRESVENSWRWDVHTLQARELENLVPPSVWRASVGSDDFVWKDYYDEASWSVGGYIDTKRGDHLCRFLDVSAGDQCKNEIKAACRSLKDRAVGSLRVCSEKVECIGEDRCVLVIGDDSRLKKLDEWLRQRGSQLPRSVVGGVQPLHEALDRLLRTGVAATVSCT
jgi:hypothetical protein